MTSISKYGPDLCRVSATSLGQPNMSHLRSADDVLKGRRQIESNCDSTVIVADVRVREAYNFTPCAYNLSALTRTIGKQYAV
jgi:hypothetical protein